MRWKGALIGALVGQFLNLGLLGKLIGAALGYSIEKNLDEDKSRSRAASDRLRDDSSPADDRERSMVYCASAAAMLAKMAKADGVVSPEEIASVESAFRRLGFSAANRRFAINVFRRAKDDNHSIFEYASEFASVVTNLELREIFYELLWDLACADGVIGAAELSILERLPPSLGIRSEWFYVFRAERLRSAGGAAGGGRRSPPPRDELADAYSILGVDPSASDGEVKQAYRNKAKKYHPDVLKAQGLPEEMLKNATEMMAKVNAAWERIRTSRGIR